MALIDKDSLVNISRRKALWSLTAATAGTGTALASIPFIQSLSIPDSKEPPYIDVNISNLAEGELKTIYILGMPVYILKRSEEQISHLKKENELLKDFHSEQSNQPELSNNFHRSIRPDIFIAFGLCTHLGCMAEKINAGQYPHENEPFISGGFFCPCHGSSFDLSGRVFKGMPAPRNLDIPNHSFIDENTVRVYHYDY